MVSDFTPIAIVWAVAVCALITCAYLHEEKSCKMSGDYRSGAEYHTFDIWSGCWLKLDDSSVVNIKELRREE